MRAACARHLSDLDHGHARGLVWDAADAKRAINYFGDVLRLNGGEFEGLPFVLLDWQAFIIGSLFGWKRDDGSRRFREAYVESGKGSGKSPLAAGVGLYMLTADNEMRAEIYAAATRREQAMILFRDAVAMVDLSPELSTRLLKSGRGERCFNLAYLAKGSFFRPIASDSSGQSGPRPHCALIDEVHEHKDRTVIDIMQAGKKGRRQPLIFQITNSGFDRTSLCFEKHDYGAKVAAGQLEDDAFFSYICALDEGEDPFESEKCWIKANPSLGVTIQKSYLEEQVRQARGMPSLESTVRRLNFCQWVDAQNPWISGDIWRACETEALTRPDFEGCPVYAGLDLSGTRDLTALAVARRNDDESIDAFVEFWTPEDTMHERGRHDRVPYDAWVRAGHMHAAPGRAVNYANVVARLSTLAPSMQFEGVAFDPYRIKFFEQDLDESGFSLNMIPHGQGFHRASESGLWMPRSIELLEQLIFDGKLRVIFNPCLRWNVASAVTESDPKNNRIFNKRKATGRIDGLVALAMAVGLALDKAAAREPDYAMYFL
ncbi:terminase large subunit [Paraburkholderia bannensis]|uniref:terminase large subunit n=1 Tax=Paraburkholderia bannensis TaxID=765414 RepID=UPI002AC34FD5|nr:terminase TerL endonuclease subunit [Paraburkholderia bannensis]